MYSKFNKNEVRFEKNNYSYNRKTVTFEDKFNIHPRDVIQKMDSAGDDIPCLIPSFPIRIPKAGVIRKNIPVTIRNPFDNDNFTQISCDINLMTGIPHLKRGIHMSRIGDLVAQSISEIISNSATKVYNSLQEYAAYLATKLGNSQYGETSSINVTGKLYYLEFVKGWKMEKNKVSLEQIELKASADCSGDNLIQSAGIQFSNMSACPCVQQTYKHALSFDEKINVSSEIPLLTHSQRCHTAIMLSGISEELPIVPLLETVDKIIVRTQNTLPREYELLNVYRAHEEPQFMEDVVRQILMGIYSLFKETFPESTIKVSSLSMESIHDYDIISEIEVSIEEISSFLMNKEHD